MHPRLRACPMGVSATVKLHFQDPDLVDLPPKDRDLLPLRRHDLDSIMQDITLTPKLKVHAECPRPSQTDSNGGMLSGCHV